MKRYGRTTSFRAKSELTIVFCVILWLASGLIWMSSYGAFIATGAFDFFLPYITIGVLAVYTVYMENLRGRGAGVFSQWASVKDAFSRWSGYLAGLFFSYFLIWMSISNGIPGMYTHFFGKEDYRVEYLKKDPWRDDCGTTVDLPQYNTHFFTFCLDGQTYSRFPRGIVQSRISVKESLFGFNVEAVEVK